MRILVVDDEKLLVKGIKFNLENDGYVVSVAYDGESALELATEGGFDLILLDLMLPKVDGLTVCQTIRTFSNVPVIMTTAKCEDTDKLIGFEYGADDYITKPFNILELKARIRAILRRSSTNNTRERDRYIKNARFTLDLMDHLIYCDGKRVELTGKEFDLIEEFMKNPSKIYTRDDLLHNVWGHDYLGDVRTVDVHVRRLREKLEENPAEPLYIMTRWGVGYYFKGE